MKNSLMYNFIFDLIYYLRCSIDIQKICVNFQELTANNVTHRWSNYSHCVINSCRKKFDKTCFFLYRIEKKEKFWSKIYFMLKMLHLHTKVNRWHLFRDIFVKIGDTKCEKWGSTCAMKKLRYQKKG